MKQIDLHLDESAYQKIRRFMAIRQMTGNTVGPDYHFISLILFGLECDEYQINITGDMLDRLDRAD